MSKGFEQPKSREDIAAIKKDRALSDADLLEGGAEYVYDNSDANKREKRLEVTKEQREWAQNEMDIFIDRSRNDDKEQMKFNSKEILAKEKQRSISDATLIKSEAEYVSNKRGELILKVTDQQLKKIKQEMITARKKEGLGDIEARVSSFVFKKFLQYEAEVDGIMDSFPVDYKKITHQHIEALRNLYTKYNNSFDDGTRHPSNWQIGEFAKRVGLRFETRMRRGVRGGVIGETIDESTEEGKARKLELEKSGFSDDLHFAVKGEESEEICKKMLEKVYERIDKFVNEYIDKVIDRVKETAKDRAEEAEGFANARVRTLYGDSSVIKKLSFLRNSDESSNDEVYRAGVYLNMLYAQEYVLEYKKNKESKESKKTYDLANLLYRINHPSIYLPPSDFLN